MTNDTNPIVSIVIVCMNNLKNLYPCLESIKKYTHVPYETFVVAYLFTPENLVKVKSDFPWVSFIESNEIRGFSENNNLALREARGKYCFVVNDDTYMNESVIDCLVSSFEKTSDKTAIISPITLNKDGSVQRCGKPKYGLFTYFLDHIKLQKLYDKHSKHTNKTGFFKTFNISGACFMIKTDIFRKMGWFDERYFFCPEDIALSTELNKLGYDCMVETSTKITHACGGTWSRIQSATMPAAEKGNYYFFGGKNIVKKLAFMVIAYTFHTAYGLLWIGVNLIKHSPKSKTMMKAHFNTNATLATNMTPKDIFIKYYNQLQH